MTFKPLRANFLSRQVAREWRRFAENESQGKAYIVGAYEHPTRKAPDKSLAQLHAEVAKGALDDAGLSKSDVDGYFCASGDTPGLGGLSMVEYMGLKLRHIDATDTGGSSYNVHVGHALEAIAAGRCNVALVTLAGRPRSEGIQTGTAPRMGNVQQPDVQFEFPYGPATANMYAMAARRHMHQFGTTSEQLAWVKVAASHHAQHNPHAMLPKVVTVEEVVNSPMVADPLHRLDCCVISDGGGALVDRPARDRQEPEAPEGEGHRRRRGEQDPGRRRRPRPHLFGGRESGKARLRDGGREAVRRQVRLDLRQLHDHRRHADRGPRLLREGARAASSLPTAT